MARTRDFLARFRPVGAPGAAAAAGVPADRAAELSAELQPVLDALADTQQRAMTIRAAAESAAQRRRRDGQVRVEAVLAAARGQAEAERADRLTRARAEAEGTVSGTVQAALAEASAIEARAAERLPAIVERVRIAVEADLLDDPAPAITEGPATRR